MITNVANIKFKKRVQQAPSHVRRNRERYVWCRESHTVLDHGTTAEVERDEMGDRSCDSSYTSKSQTSPTVRLKTTAPEHVCSDRHANMC